MRYYVWCKTHPQEKIYITLQNNPRLRNQIEHNAYRITCAQLSKKSTHIYFTNEIKAEVGLELLEGLILGSILFLINPLLGIIGAAVGLFGIGADEERKVKAFNES